MPDPPRTPIGAEPFGAIWEKLNGEQPVLTSTYGEGACAPSRSSP